MIEYVKENSKNNDMMSKNNDIATYHFSCKIFSQNKNNK